MESDFVRREPEPFGRDSHGHSPLLYAKGHVAIAKIRPVAIGGLVILGRSFCHRIRCTSHGVAGPSPAGSRQLLQVRNR